MKHFLVNVLEDYTQDAITEKPAYTVTVYIDLTASYIIKAHYRSNAKNIQHQ